MPHLVLECSANVPDQPDLHRVLRRLHDAMAAAAPTRLFCMNCRRLIPDFISLTSGPTRARRGST